MTEAYGLSIPDQLVDVCTPARCALIVYDMQVGIVPQMSAGREIAALCHGLQAISLITPAGGRGGQKPARTRRPRPHPFMKCFSNRRFDRSASSSVSVTDFALAHRIVNVAALVQAIQNIPIMALPRP